VISLNAKIVDQLKLEYQVDYINDMLLQENKHIHFYFTLNGDMTTFYIISGDPSCIGLPKKEFFTSDEIIAVIKLDNELAEVEGKNSFISDLITRIKTMKDQCFIYLPIQHDNQTLWLYISLHRVEKSTQRLIFGQVLRVLDRTPNDIIHYKKTYQDPLTRLFTRETLKKHLSNLKSYDGAYGIYFDIDKFKEINDAYGHQQGDQLLKDIANSFIDNWEKDVIYYRLGGDEFFIYVNKHSQEDIIKRAEQLICDIENLNEMTKKIGVSASVGIVPITPLTNDYHKLLDLGDTYMYKSKRKGKGNISIHNL